MISLSLICQTKTAKPPKTTASAEVRSQNQSKAESLPKKAGDREWSLPHTTTNLSRSRSMGSLRNCLSSVSDLKGLFESKNDTQAKVNRSMRAESWTLPSRAKMTDSTPVVNGHTGERQTAQKKKAAPSTDADGQANVDAKVNDVNANVNTKEQEVTDMLIFSFD